MDFQTAQDCENVIWNLRYADIPREQNRALINALFNGAPPYSASEQEENRFTTNINDLSPNRIFQDVMRQYTNAFLTPGQYFRVKLDYGPAHKRDEWGEIITSQLNKILKESQRYRQTLRDVFSQVVLHGVGPVVWNDSRRWHPSMQMMCDLLIPSQTLLTMENLSYFAVYRRYTPTMLAKLITKPRPDPGWHRTAAKSAIKWAVNQVGQTLTSMEMNWAPERMAEDIKANSGFWSSDAVPTINCWDVFFENEDEDNMGWKRRIIFDTPSGIDSYDPKSPPKVTKDTRSVIDTRNQFLYSSGDRIYARNLSQIFHSQYADGSVVAPRRYHSVRSLGFLLYALCHLHNRLTCRIFDSTFENLMQYIRVTNTSEAERLKKLDLINLGFLPDGFSFVSSTERWAVNQNLIQMVLNMNQQQMQDSAPSGYSQNTGRESSPSVEKTATQIMAEINKASSTVGIIMAEAAEYQTPQYKEICRRFCLQNSPDIEVLKFRAAVLARGVPLQALNVERWNIEPERVMGNGNKQVQLAQAQLMMSVYDRLEPNGQRKALRKFLFAVMDNPDDVNDLVPSESGQTTNSMHDAELASATLLMGLPMSLKLGVSHSEYAAVLLGAMAVELKKIEAAGTARPDQILGLLNISGQGLDGQPTSQNGVAAHIAVLSQDRANKAEVKMLSDALAKLMNQTKAFAQQLAEQQGENNGGVSPELAAKLKERMVLAEVKAENARAAQQLKLQHKQESHDQQLLQQREAGQLENAATIRRTEVDVGSKDVKTAAEIRRENAKAANEPSAITE